MNAIDRDTLMKLTARSDWPSVSLYLPTDHLGIHTDADRIRLRNLVKQACERLQADGQPKSSCDILLSGVLDIVSNDASWAGGPKGVAFFVSPGSTDVLWVDGALPEMAVVGDRFYLRPLYPSYIGEAKFWALAIDTNKTRLFHMDRASIEEVALPAGTPISLAEEIKNDDGEESLQYHTVPGATPQGAQGVNTAMFHGHGGEKDVDKSQRERFMHDLSAGVVERIGAESSEPLVLLGVHNLLDEFRATSAYSHITTERVEGATDYLSAADVQRKVLLELAPRLAAAATADVDEYKSLAGTGRTSSDASEIIAAAAAGRVKTLIMDDSSGPWGFFDRTTFDVTRLCPIEPRYLRDTMAAEGDPDMFECGWDLIDLAAAETVRHGGAVRAYRGEDAPFVGAAAVFRY